MIKEAPLIFRMLTVLRNSGTGKLALSTRLRESKRKVADFGSIQSYQALTRKTEKRVLTVYISLFLLNIVKQTNAVLRIFDLQG